MIFWTDVSLNSLHFIVLKKFHINVMSTYQKLTISFIKKKVQIKMLHIIPNTSEVTCNFSKLFVTFGLDTL